MNHTVVPFNFHYDQFCKRTSNKYQIENVCFYLNTKKTNNNNKRRLLNESSYGRAHESKYLSVLDLHGVIYLFLLYLIIPIDTYQSQFSTFQKSHSRVVVTAAVMRRRKHCHQTPAKLALTKITPLKDLR